MSPRMVRTGLGIILALFVAAVSTVPATAELADPVSHPKFVTPLPNPLDPSFIFAPDGVTTTGEPYFEVGIYEFRQSLGLFDEMGNPLLTTVWGYGKDQASATYPGRTFVVQRDQPINVRWTNNLVDSTGAPLSHLLPVDSTLHWADPLGQGHVPGPYTGPVPAVTHVHGGHTESASDGLPDAWFTPGFALTGMDFKKETYHYDNDQEAGTVWYHDHALGITRLNVYAGLAGFFLIRDAIDTGDRANPLGLPTFPYEVPIVIQDRMFDENGELVYPTEPEEPGAPDPSALPEFFGEYILVNGQAWPFLDVEPRKYRLRFLNGSDSRFYNIWFSKGGRPTGSGPMIYQIGTDNGFLYSPVALNQVTFGPGERLDTIVDFSAFAGETLILRNNARSPYPKGDTVSPQTTGQLMAFRVSSTPVSDPSVIPATLRPSPIVPPGPAITTRQLILYEGTDMYGRLQPLLGTAADGALLWDEPITENPMLDDVEIWEVYNLTPDAHPVHQHLVAFQILDRQKFKANVGPHGELSNIRRIGQSKKPDPNEAGWKDTAQMFPGEVTRVIARYDREGKYVWHCHILSHEDHEMMRPYCVGDLAGCESGMSMP